MVFCSLTKKFDTEVDSNIIAAKGDTNIDTKHEADSNDMQKKDDMKKENMDTEEHRDPAEEKTLENKRPKFSDNVEDGPGVATDKNSVCTI